MAGLIAAQAIAMQIVVLSSRKCDLSHISGLEFARHNAYRVVDQIYKWRWLPEFSGNSRGNAARSVSWRLRHPV